MNQVVEQKCVNKASLDKAIHPRLRNEIPGSSEATLPYQLIGSLLIWFIDTRALTTYHLDNTKVATKTHLITYTSNDHDLKLKSNIQTILNVIP